MKKMLVLVLVLATMLSLAACGSGETGSADELNVALYDEVGDLSPWGTTVVSSTFIRQ